MKKDGTQKIGIKKLTIARINTDSMKKIEGGSSVLPTDNFAHTQNIIDSVCYGIK